MVAAGVAFQSNENVISASDVIGSPGVSVMSVMRAPASDSFTNATITLQCA